MKQKIEFSTFLGQCSVITHLYGGMQIGIGKTEGEAFRKWVEVALDDISRHRALMELASLVENPRYPGWGEDAVDRQFHAGTNRSVPKD